MESNSENPEANKFIEEFSKVYRHILSSQQHELITLETEIEYMEPYVFLLKKRFPASVYVSIDVPEKYLSWYLPPVALQMLIENAIKQELINGLSKQNCNSCLITIFVAEVCGG